MACFSYGSTSGVSLYYGVDADPDAAVNSTYTWNEVPITSVTLSGSLSTSISNRITAARSYAGSSVTSGEVSGSIGFELESNAFASAMLQAVLQSSTGLAADGDAITNGSTPMCLQFLLKVFNGTAYDYYVYRGCQVDSLSLDISPGSLITGEAAIQGIRVGSGAKAATDGSNDTLTSLPVGWTLTPYTSGQIMSSVYAIQDFEVQDTSGSDIGVVAQQVSLQFSNQLRQQQAVGTGTPWAAGVASGRFQATFSLNAYYSGPTIIDAMTNDSDLKITFNLLNPDGDGWTFLADYVKVTDGPPPKADGADQDLMSSTEFQAFESASNGTVKITRVDVT